MKKFIEFGIYLLVFCLPWQTRWIIEAGKINGGASEYLTYSLYGVDILLVGLLILALLYFFLGTKSPIGDLVPKKTSIYPFMEVKLLLIFLTLGAVSIFWAENKTLAFYRETQIILALGFFWLCVNFTKISKLALAFVISLISPTLLGLWQFFAQTTFANKWLGLAMHKTSLGGTSVVETFSNGIVDGRWLRAYGGFDHPNIFGGVIAIGLLIILGLLMQTQKEKIKKNVFLYFSVVIFSAGLFASLSRSAWLALLLGIISVGTFLFLQKNFAGLKNLIYESFIIVVVFLVMFLGYQNLVNVRVEGGTRLENLSLDQREVYWKQAKTLILQKPIAGVGIGNYIESLAKFKPNDQAWIYQPVHNVLILVWAELGIFGVLVFVGFLAGLFWNLVRKNKLAGALLIALLPMLLLDHWLWSFHFGLLFFALVIALATSFSGEKRVRWN
ncbi:MAG: O-antigen ligase family protein [Candidatus Moraniibacteriota bacterium]